MNHKPRTEERQIIQWANEPQVMNRRKTDNTMVKWKNENTMICKTLHRNWKIDQYEPHKGVNLGTP